MNSTTSSLSSPRAMASGSSANDAYGGLVGADDPRTAQPSEDSRHLIVEARRGAAEHRIQRSLADLQGKQLEEQLCQTTVADRVGEAQVDRQRQDVHTERRTFFHALGHRRQRDAAAARAVPSIPFHAGHHWANHGKLYLVVATVQHLVRFTQRRVAMHSGHRLRNHCLIGIEGQRPAATLTAQTALARHVALGLLRLIGLLSLRWWQAGIAGCLRRLAELGFEFRDVLFGRLKPLPQRLD